MNPKRQAWLRNPSKQTQAPQATARALGKSKGTFLLPVTSQARWSGRFSEISGKRRDARLFRLAEGCGILRIEMSTPCAERLTFTPDEGGPASKLDDRSVVIRELTRKLWFTRKQERRLIMRTTLAGIMTVLGTMVAATAAIAGDLAPPVQIHAGGRPIDVQLVGHSAPFYGDVDGDGLSDLLVGQFDEGRLRIYPNLGTNTSPRFEGYHWFEAGGAIGSVPAG